jgi:hypothetical protein
MPTALYTAIAIKAGVLFPIRARLAGVVQKPVRSSFIQFLWSFSAMLSEIGLALALAGVFCVAFGVVRYLWGDNADASAPFPRAAWRTPLAKFGFLLLVLGAGLCVAVFAVRLMLPGG